MKTQHKVLEQYEFEHKMNFTMYLVFKNYLNTKEDISIGNMIGGSYGEDHELTVFNVSESKAKSLQSFQNSMLGL